MSNRGNLGTSIKNRVKKLVLLLHHRSICQVSPVLPKLLGPHKVGLILSSLLLKETVLEY